MGFVTLDKKKTAKYLSDFQKHWQTNVNTLIYPTVSSRYISQGNKTKRQLWRKFLENYRVSNKD